MREDGAVNLAAGSPPRMRGKGVKPCNERVGMGITPACAGKRAIHNTVQLLVRDHPRMCGEKPTLRCPCLPCRGSPPHVRGKAVPPLLVSDRYEDHPRVCGEKGPQTMKGGHCARIAPAYAGESTCNTVGRQHRGEHPRVCGEKPKVMNLVLVRPGSPPHVRGKVDVLSKIDTLIGITPAYAGKSFLQRTAQCRCQDHPRVCGEKTKKIP